MIYDILTGREVKASGGKVDAGITITDEKGVRYMVCSVAYGETKVMQYDEYIKRTKMIKCADGEFRILKEIENIKCKASDGISINEINADGKTYKVGEITEIDGEQYMVDDIKIKGNEVSIDASMKIDAPMDSIVFKASIE